MHSQNPISGIILAGGRSTRMGNDKALLKWKDKTLLQNAVDILRPFCQEIFISSSNPAHQIPFTILVPDAFPQQAPLIGIYSCLRKTSTQYNIVLSCDMPLINGEVLNALITRLSGQDMVLPLNGEQLEPLCAIYSKNLLPIIEDNIKIANYSLHYLVSKSNHTTVIIPRQTPDLFSNLNTPGDLKNIN